MYLFIHIDRFGNDEKIDYFIGEIIVDKLPWYHLQANCSSYATKTNVNELFNKKKMYFIFFANHKIFYAFLKL